jgi:hypothetical protein
MAITTSKDPKTAERDVAINVPIPAELHRRFRLKAVRKNMSVKAATVEAIRQWVREA